MTDILMIKSLNKHYDAGGKTVLNDIDLTVAKGEFVGIFGPSGCGKTTLFNILTGLDYATSGAAYIDGRDMTKMLKNEIAPFRRQKVGTLFRDIRLIDGLTVKENISFPLILNGKTPKEMNEIVEGMMDFLGIEGLSNKAISDITQEEMQQVSAARALVVNPMILLADEPTGDLDSTSVANFMEMLMVMTEPAGTDSPALRICVTVPSSKTAS